jgi:hypothetical protein
VASEMVDSVPLHLQKQRELFSEGRGSTVGIATGFGLRDPGVRG